MAFIYGELTRAQLHISASDLSSPIDGLIYYNTSSGVKWYSGSAWKTAADLDSAQTFTNKSISGSTNTLTNIPSTEVKGLLLRIRNDATFETADVTTTQFSVYKDGDPRSFWAHKEGIGLVGSGKSYVIDSANDQVIFDTTGGTASFYPAQGALILKNKNAAAYAQLNLQNSDNQGYTLVGAGSAYGESNKFGIFSSFTGNWAMKIDSSSNVSFHGTGALSVPSGTTAQRPPSPSNSMMRYNSETNTFEGYKAGAWSSVGGASQLSELTDTLVTGAQDGRPIAWDSNSNKFVPHAGRRNLFQPYYPSASVGTPLTMVTHPNANRDISTAASWRTTANCTLTVHNVTGTDFKGYKITGGASAVPATYWVDSPMVPVAALKGPSGRSRIEASLRAFYLNNLVTFNGSTTIQIVLRDSVGAYQYAQTLNALNGDELEVAAKVASFFATTEILPAYVYANFSFDIYYPGSNSGGFAAPELFFTELFSGLPEEQKVLRSIQASVVETTPSTYHSVNLANNQILLDINIYLDGTREHPAHNAATIDSRSANSFTASSIATTFVEYSFITIS